MSLTHFPNGLSSFGAPVLPSASLIHTGVAVDNAGATPRSTKHYWVHGNVGNDGNSGLSPETPLRTMQAAFNQLGSGDVVHLNGKITENLTTPAGVFDVTIIGEGNRPRHADAHTTNNGYSTADWRASSNSVPNLIIQQQGWRIVNILFVGATSSDCIKLSRDAGSGDAERDSGHAEIINCRFASGSNGINDTGGNVNVLVQNNRFEALTGFAILGVGNIGVGQSDWKIVDNTFDGFTNGIKIAAFGCRIQNNTFTAGGTPNTTVVCNVSNGGGQDNFIIDNWFQTATANFNTPDVVGNATDVWFNTSIDSFTAGLESGHEVGRPA